MAEDSILKSIKKALGLGEDYAAFDPEILMFINSVFSTLNDLGIGPDDGFQIEDDEATWDDFLDGDIRKNSVQTYVFLRVRLLFDPPTTGYLVTSMERQCSELEWRLSVQREGDRWPAESPA